MFFVCCNIIGSLELVLSFGMVRSTSPELGARGTAKRGLGSLEMLRGDFFLVSQGAPDFSFVSVCFGFFHFFICAVFDYGIFLYSVN